MADPDTCNARLCNYTRGSDDGDPYGGWDEFAPKDDTDATGRNDDDTAKSIFRQIEGGDTAKRDKYKEPFNNLREASNHLISSPDMLSKLRDNIAKFESGDSLGMTDYCLSTADIYKFRNASTDNKSGDSANQDSANKSGDGNKTPEKFIGPKPSKRTCITIAIVVGIVVGLLLVLGLYLYKRWIRNLKYKRVKPTYERAERSNWD